MGVESGLAGGLVFRIGHETLQFFLGSAPLAAPGVEGGLRKRTPANVFRQDRLLFGCGWSAFLFDFLESSDGVQVGFEFGFIAALSDLIGGGYAVVV
jgi:hypothetical protein